MNQSRDLVLGFDFGTSSVKAALFDAEGCIAGNATASYPLLLPAPGWAEQRPLDWWNAMCAVTPRVLAAARVDGSRVAAIGIAAQMCGVVPVDRSGTELGNALIWLDTRSSAFARDLIGGWIRIGGGYGVLNLIRWMRLTGGAPNPSGKDPPSKMLWLRRHRPDQWRQVHKLLDVKDYLIHRCTGRFVTTYDCAHLTWLYDARPGHKAWSSPLLARLGIDGALLPEIARATDVIGSLGAGAAASLGLRPGTPVTGGVGDVSAAALASGVSEYGAPHLNIGTSAWFGAHLSRSRVNPLTGIGCISSAEGDGYLLIATQENAGACVGWALRNGGYGPTGYDAFEEAAAQTAPRRDGPMFFPWLYGERVPIDDRHARGGFANVSIGHDRGALARAVYEGVALNLRWAMRDFDRLAGSHGLPLRMVGGGATSTLWCKILADVLQRPLQPVEAPALAGARGSAMTAAVGAGWYGTLQEASAMTRASQCYMPDAGLADLYAERFAQFTYGYRRLRPWYRRFSAGSPDALSE